MNNLAKEVYKIDVTRRRLRRVKPLRKQVQNLYLQNWILRTKNRELKGTLQQREK